MPFLRTERGADGISKVSIIRLRKIIFVPTYYVYSSLSRQRVNIRCNHIVAIDSEIQDAAQVNTCA